MIRNDQISDIYRLAKKWYDDQMYVNNHKNMIIDSGINSQANVKFAK